MPVQLLTLHTSLRLMNQLSVPEEQERGHRHQPEALGYIPILAEIDAGKPDKGHIVGGGGVNRLQLLTSSISSHPNHGRKCDFIIASSDKKNKCFYAVGKK